MNNLIPCWLCCESPYAHSPGLVKRVKIRADFVPSMTGGTRIQNFRYEIEVKRCPWCAGAGVRGKSNKEKEL